MIPILYDAAETAFATNGIGILTDAADVTVEEELNGTFELEMVYPVKGIHFSEIAQRSIILSQIDPLSNPQPFRVYRITKPLNGNVRVYARHLAYDLMGIPVSPFSATGAAMALTSLKDHAATDCPFEFVTDKSATGTLTVSVPKPIWSILGGEEGSVLDTFGGEYLFDRWEVNLLTHRGSNQGVSIRYGKNLTSFEQDENCADCCTGLYPYWADSEGNIIELPEKIVRAVGNYGYTKIVPIDFSSEWETEPTEDKLRARAEKYISDNEVGVPDVSWTIGFAALEQTEEYKDIALLERVLLGDTVSVEFAEMGVSASARVVATKYKPLRERYDSVTLGKVRSNLADTIVKQQQEIEKKPSYDAITRATEFATKLILGAKGGSVRVLDTDGDGQPDTLYVADNNDPAQAKKVWRWNYAGWGASTNGYNGPFTMAATLESGLLAEFVTAAHLTAGTIQSPNGAIFIDLDAGTFRAKAIEEVADSVNDLEQGLSDTNSNLANNYSTTSQMEAAIKVVADQISTKVSSGDVESIILQKADSIRLKASKISWSSVYSSMTENGQLTCSAANIKGIIECGNKNGYWMRLGDAGKLEGGYGSDTVGTLNCADFTGAEVGMGIKAENIIFDGYLWVYDGYGCWSCGADGWVTVVSDLSIEPYGNGGVSWSYSFTDLEFQRGLCVTIL